MEIRQVEFQFKGNRDYIQGPDLFNQLTDIGYSMNRLKNIRFVAHRFIRTPLCRMYLTDDKAELNAISDIAARCQFDVDDTTRWLALTEFATEAAGARCSFEEDRIIALCRTENSGITLTDQSPYSFIETIVSMNKHLHLSLFPDVAGKWIFTRADLDAGCDERRKLALRFRHNMNFRLTKSDIMLDDLKIGDLYFSLVRP